MKENIKMNTFSLSPESYYENQPVALRNCHIPICTMRSHLKSAQISKRRHCIRDKNEIAADVTSTTLNFKMKTAS